MRRREADRRYARRFAAPEFTTRVAIPRRDAGNSAVLKHNAKLVKDLVRQHRNNAKVRIWWKAVDPDGREMRWEPDRPLPADTVFLRCYGDLA